jgi:hypothetical protein
VRSTDNGLNFSEPLNVAPGKFTVADSPVLFSAGNSQLSLLLSGFNNKDAFPSREIYLTRSFDNGASFSPLIDISNGNGDSDTISAAIDSLGTLNVVWRDTQNKNYDIYLSRLFVGEQSFTAPLNLSQNLGISDSPAIAIDANNNMTIAWQDDAAGNNDIFLTRLSSADLPLPTITSFNPQQAAIGDAIEVDGTNLQRVLDAKIGKLSAQFNIIADQKIIITVPNGAVSGGVTITTDTGVARSAGDLLITGKVGLTPTRLDLGVVNVGASFAKTVQLINSGNVAHKVTSIMFNNPSFSIGSLNLPITLQPGEEKDLPIVFTPQNLGFTTALAAIFSDDQSPIPVNINLTGAGSDAQPPSVKIQSPVGGEVFRPGDNVKITWMASDNTALASQDIQLSTDSGQTFSTIASGITGAREFNWDAPSINTNSARIRIVATDLSGNQGSSTSPADFSITVKKKKKSR